MNIVQSKKKNSGFRSYTVRIYLIFKSLLCTFEFKVIWKFQEQTFLKRFEKSSKAFSFSKRFYDSLGISR